MVNFNPKISPKILLVVVAVAVIGYAGYAGEKRVKVNGKADAEAELQKAEITECRSHLTAFYQAWNKYRGDHKGVEPNTLADLVPKYIKDPGMLMCPTAVRWAKGNVRLDQGAVEIDKKNYPETYGFKWMTAGYSLMVKKKGNKAPLVVCSTHCGAVYFATYGKVPVAGTFDAEKINSLLPAVRNTPTLAVLRDGSIVELAFDSE